MGKVTGFLEWARETPDKRPVEERLRDWNEIPRPPGERHDREQAGRCMDCGIPFCQQGCPLGNPIPDFNDRVFRGDWLGAHRALAGTNNFPEFTGRLCPAPCESACVLAIDGAPVTIEEMEKAIAERAFFEGWVTPRQPTRRSGRRVAIVGSGPAGLAAAQQLNRAGHDVTVYERSDRIGGLLRYGIPDFKLEKWVIDRRLEVLEAEGLTVRTGVDVGVDLTFETLRREHDALLLAMGAGKARRLEVEGALPGAELDGVTLAMPFLEQQNRRVAGLPIEGKELTAEGKRVVILGGGDTGSDCLGTSLRQGARSVAQVELMPAPPDQRPGGNPWPQWPLVFRTSSSQEEGGERRFARLTKRLEGENGALKALISVEVELKRDADGRTRLAERPGTEQRDEVDLLILAMGFVGTEGEDARSQLGLPEASTFSTDERYATPVEGVFAAGDARRGQSLIVWAISEGREAARAIDSYLIGGPSNLPTRGKDRPFGGR